jgi:hypothetical protein
MRPTAAEKVMKKLICLMLFAVAVAAFNGCKAKPAITQDELVSHSQELFNAVAAGDKTPWQKYVADDVMYFDEKGRNMNKAALVADIEPLPKGYSGSIRIAKVQSHIERDIAIMSYDLDEKETIFGQDLTARYHATDTWMRRNGQWQIVAGQVLRYYEDPALGKIDPRKFKAYVGTYQLAPGNTLVISTDGSQLFRQRGDRAKETLLPESSDIFFRKGVEGRILFRLGENGKIDALIDRRNNEDVVWKKIA